MRKLNYKIPEAAEVSGFSRSRLYELISNGELESIKVGGRRFIPTEALEDYIAKLRDEQRVAS